MQANTSCAIVRNQQASITKLKSAASPSHSSASRPAFTRAAQGVIGCAKTYGAARLEAACERALGHDSPHYRTVKSILATGADLQPLVEPQTPAAYGRARFARSAAELFAAEPGTLH